MILTSAQSKMSSKRKTGLSCSSSFDREKCRLSCQRLCPQRSERRQEAGTVKRVSCLRFLLFFSVKAGKCIGLDSLSALVADMTN